MRIELAALVATATIAIVAAVFAIWPAVADAPWENETSLRELNCEARLDFRVNIIEAGEFHSGIAIGAPVNADGVKDYDAQLAKAENEIERYC